jgi:hypothetical protein
MKARTSVSFPFEKPPGEKPFNTTSSYVSETDWDAIDAMKDDDIVLTEECPEMQAHDFERGRLLYNGRQPTLEEIEEGIRIILQYLNRSQGAKSRR